MKCINVRVLYLYYQYEYKPRCRETPLSRLSCRRRESRAGRVVRLGVDSDCSGHRLRRRAGARRVHRLPGLLLLLPPQAAEYRWLACYSLHRIYVYSTIIQPVLFYCIRDFIILYQFVLIRIGKQAIRLSHAKALEYSLYLE